MKTELEPMDLGFRIVLRFLDDETQKDTQMERKIESGDYEEALKAIREDYERMEAENPTDNRFGFTMLQQVTTNMLGVVTREWYPVAWFGSNDKYLIGKPELNPHRLDPVDYPPEYDEDGKRLDDADLKFLKEMRKLFGDVARQYPFVPSLPLL